MSNRQRARFAPPTAPAGQSLTSSRARIYKGMVLTPLAPEAPSADYQVVTDFGTDTYAVT